MTDGRFAFAAAVRVIHRVHNRTADFRTLTEISRLTRFTEGYDFVLYVTYLTDRRAAFQRNVSHFAAGQTKRCVFAFGSHDLRREPRASCDLSAFAGRKFHVVHHRTYGNVFKRQRVAHFDIRFRAAHHLVAHVQSEGSEDIRLHAVRIYDQRDVCASVRIVFDSNYSCRDIIFSSLEVDDSVLPPPMCLQVILP